MKFTQEFEIDQPRERVWDFFDQPTAVAECLPGVESVEEIEPDVFTVVVTQKVGPFSATFESRLQITEKVAGERIAFKATGKAVRGAIGNFRAESVVGLSSTEVGTRVNVDSEAALAGVLGSVGQRIIANQAEKVTAQFAANLQARLRGEAPQSAAPPIQVPLRPKASSTSATSLGMQNATAQQIAVVPSSSIWLKVAAIAALANLAVALVILGKVI